LLVIPFTKRELTGGRWKGEGIYVSFDMWVDVIIYYFWKRWRYTEYGKIP
jgi:hypothetical protein